MQRDLNKRNIDNVCNTDNVTITGKKIVDFPYFSTISIHQKRKGTRLLSLKGEYTSCLASCFFFFFFLLKASCFLSFHKEVKAKGKILRQP